MGHCLCVVLYQCVGRKEEEESHDGSILWDLSSPPTHDVRGGVCDCLPGFGMTL